MKVRMKHLKKPLFALGLLASLSAQAQVQGDVSGPKWSQRRPLTSLLSSEQEATLSAEERSEIIQIQVFQDVRNPKLYYYIPPIVVSQWKENRYSIHLELQEKVFALISELANSNLEAMKILTSRVVSDREMTNEEVQSIIAIVDTIDKAKLELFKDTLSAYRSLLPAKYANLPINSADDAIALASDIMTKLPSVRASVSLAPGFSKSRAEAFTKVKNILSSTKFVSIAAVNEYTFQPNTGSTPSIATSTSTEDKLAQQDYKSRTEMVNYLFQPIFGLRVTPNGTTVGMDLYYNLVRGWGYSSTNPFAGAGGIAFEGGDFYTSFPISARFDGRVDCQFDGEIIKRKLFKVDQMPGLALMVDNSIDIENSSRSNVKCELRDLQGNLLSADGLIQKGSIDPSIIPPGSSLDSFATGLNSYIQDKIQKFTDENTRQFKAAQDLRDAIFEKAKETSDGYLRMNIPMEEYQKAKWITEPSCREFPVTVGCKRHGWKHGHKVKALGDVWECKEPDVVTQKECVDVQKRIIETFQRPVTVRGFAEEIPFVRNFDVKTTYPVSSQMQSTVRVSAPNDACFARYEISNPNVNNPARFSSCDGNLQKDELLKSTQNTSGEVSRPQDNNSGTVVFY